jgi:hypothetical protein
MSTADELIKLDALRKSSVLTQGEFDAEMNAVPRPSDSGGLTWGRSRVSVPSTASGTSLW